MKDLVLEGTTDYPKEEYNEIQANLKPKETPEVDLINGKRKSYLCK